MNHSPLDYQEIPNRENGDFFHKTWAFCLDAPASLMLILAIWQAQFKYMLPISLLLFLVLYLVLFVSAIARPGAKLLRVIFAIGNGISFMILALGIFFKSNSFPFGSELMMIGVLSYSIYHLLLPTYYHQIQRDKKLTLAFTFFALAVITGLIVFLFKVMLWPQSFALSLISGMALGGTALYFCFLMFRDWATYRILVFYLPRLLVLITMLFVHFINPIETLGRILQNM